MLMNRSVPTDVLLPHIAYPDVAEAAAWLTTTFGFIEHHRYAGPDGAVSGVQMRLGNAFFMLHKSKPGELTPDELGYGTQSLTVFVQDVDAHFAHTLSKGVRIFEELHETVYGERQYGVPDLAGHRWLFPRHAQDISPDQWGAKIMTPLAE